MNSNNLKKGIQFIGVFVITYGLTKNGIKHIGNDISDGWNWAKNKFQSKKEKDNKKEKGKKNAA